MYKIEYIPNKKIEVKNGKELSILNQFLEEEIPIYDEADNIVMTTKFIGSIDTLSPTTPVKIKIIDNHVNIYETSHELTNDEEQNLNNMKKQYNESINNDIQNIENVSDFELPSLDKLNEIDNLQKTSQEKMIKTLDLILNICDDRDKPQFKKYKNHYKYKNGLLRKLNQNQIIETLDLRLQLTIDVMLEYPEKTIELINNYKYSKGEKYLIIENVYSLESCLKYLNTYCLFIEDKTNQKLLFEIIEMVTKYKILLNHNLDLLFDTTDVKVYLIEFMEQFSKLNKTNIEDINYIVTHENLIKNKLELEAMINQFETKVKSK